MARDKHVADAQMQLVPVSFAHHMLPGSFESARTDLIDQALDLSAFEARFRHDDVGVPAFAPAVLRTMVRLAYRTGMVSSRAMEAACREHVRCMASAGGSQPHVTTLAERHGPKGRLCQSYRTDNESAKMATGEGVIQGDTGVAAGDEQPQILVAAQAHGVGQAQERLVPVIEALRPQLAPASVVTADAGDHRASTLAALARRRLDASIPDAGYRKRDPRVAAQPRHQEKSDPLWDKRPTPTT
jgi:hypothetical protein